MTVRSEFDDSVNGTCLFSSNITLNGREPPHNIDAEQAVLGAILVDPANRLYSAVASFLRPEHFFDEIHGAIYDAIGKLNQAGMRASPITLAPYLESVEPINDHLTVRNYLVRLAKYVPTNIDAASSAQIVVDLAVRRRVLQLTRNIEERAYDTSEGSSPEAFITEALRDLDNLTRAAPSGLTSFSVARFGDKPVPPREWHVKGLVPANNSTLLSGDGGTGKSLLAAQLAMATVLGRTWLGHEVTQGPVVYLGAEDDHDEMHRRFADIAREQSIALDQLEELHLCCVAGKNAVLATCDESGRLEPTLLWHDFRRIVREVKPRFVVYDTLADLFSGNENVRTQAQQFIGLLRGLAIETKSAALLLSHPSLSGISSGAGTSGSTAWSNAVRARLYLERVRRGSIEPDPDARIFRTMKSNYGPTGGVIRLRWHKGVFILDGSPENALTEVARNIEAERVFLELVDAYTRAGRVVSDRAGANYAPSLFAKDPKGVEIGRDALARAMNRLFHANKITTRKYGPPSRQRSRLEVA